MPVRRMPVRRRPVRALVAAAVVLLGVVGPTAPARATDGGTSCTGFGTTGTGCNVAGAGFGDFGYSTAMWHRHWFQRAGHNCTNYVAYRLIRRGEHIAQPAGTLDGRGAAGWLDAVTAPGSGAVVASTPAVGDVAWWRPGERGAGPSGHVAHVEAVAPGYVDVSEDNASGDFRWRRLTTGGGHFPHAFLRFTGGDGSPVGATTIMSPAPGTVVVTSTLRDPDDPDGALTFGIDIGGQHHVVTGSQFGLRWIRSSTAFGGPTVVTVVASNVGAGLDHRFSRVVDIVRPPAPATSIRASFVDSSIRKSQTPRLKVTVNPAAARGRVTISKGSVTLRTVTIGADTRRPLTVSLPRQSRGTKTIRVRFRPSNHYGASSRTLTLRVR